MGELPAQRGATVKSTKDRARGVAKAGDFLARHGIRPSAETERCSSAFEGHVVPEGSAGVNDGEGGKDASLATWTNRFGSCHPSTESKAYGVPSGTPAEDDEAASATQRSTLAIRARSQSRVVKNVASESSMCRK